MELAAVELAGWYRQNGAVRNLPVHEFPVDAEFVYQQRCRLPDSAGIRFGFYQQRSKRDRQKYSVDCGRVSQRIGQHGPVSRYDGDCHATGWRVLHLCWTGQTRNDESVSCGAELCGRVRGVSWTNCLRTICNYRCKRVFERHQQRYCRCERENPCAGHGR